MESATKENPTEEKETEDISVLDGPLQPWSLPQAMGDALEPSSHYRWKLYQAAIRACPEDPLKAWIVVLLVRLGCNRDIPDDVTAKSAWSSLIKLDFKLQKWLRATKKRLTMVEGRGKWKEDINIIKDMQHSEMPMVRKWGKSHSGRNVALAHMCFIYTQAGVGAPNGRYGEDVCHQAVGDVHKYYDATKESPIAGLWAQLADRTKVDYSEVIDMVDYYSRPRGVYI